MGANNTKKEKLEIINDTNVASSLKQLNEHTSEMMMEMINTNAQKTVTGADAVQKVEILNTKAKGDVIIGVDQKSSVKLDVSAIVSSDVNSDLVQDVTSQMQTKLKEQMTMSQSAAKEEGEQMIAGLMESVNNAMNAATGGNNEIDSNTSIQNILKIKNDTELTNKIKSSVNEKIVNETLQEISTKVFGKQETKIKNTLSEEGKAVIGVNQDMMLDAGVEAILEAGTGSEIISKMTGVSKADVEKSIEGAQDASQIKKGTIDSAGDAVSDVVDSTGDAASKVIDSTGNAASKMLSGMMLPLIIIGGAGLLIFFMMNSGGGSAPPPMYGPPPPMYGGGLKIIRRIFRRIYKYIMSIGKNNIILFLKIAVLALLFHEIYKKKQENFEKIKTPKVKDLLFSIDGKYITEELCLDSDKSKALKFRLYYIDEKYYIFILDITNKEQYFKIDNGILQLAKMDADKEKFQFDIVHKQNNKYIIQQNEHFIGLQENCLIVTDKENAINIQIE